jgi:methionine biosynthesis protein MetW
MFGHSDRDYFERLWRRKTQENPHSDEYIPGANLRVDEALRTLDSGTRVLDIGCGNGVLLSMLKSQFGEFYGIDISESAIQIARQKAIQAETINLNIDPLPFPDKFFDAIAILSTLQYFYDMDRVLQECYRVLSPSGVLILSVPNIRAIWRVGRLLFKGSFTGVSLDEGNYDGGTLHYFAMLNIQALLARNGFKVVLAKGIFCKPGFITHFPNRGVAGSIKREFFSAEIFIKALKTLENPIQL